MLDGFIGIPCLFIIGFCRDIGLLDILQLPDCEYDDVLNGNDVVINVLLGIVTSRPNLRRWGDEGVGGFEGGV